MASQIDMREPFVAFEAEEEMLTYVNPRMYKEFLHAIATEGRTLVKEISEANAVWMHQDGSVDLEHRDNKFHHFRLVTKKGKLKFRFGSVEEKLI